MSPHYFNHLDPHLQLDLVMAQGLTIGKAKKYNLHLNLFQFCEFYIEMLSKEDNDELVTIRAFDDMDHLEPYLEKIDISDCLPVV